MNFYKSLVCFFLLFSSLQAEIIEITQMNEIHPHIKPNSLIIFDLDNTLIEPVQAVGSDQWFYPRLEYYLNSGLLYKQALKKTLAEWTAIQYLTEVQIVEKGSDKIISHLQSEGFKIMGLTTRGLQQTGCTVNQLESIKVDLTATAPTKADIFFTNSGKPVLFHHGVLFTNASHKGTALFKLLDAIGYEPTHIVFINDKAAHLRDIEETSEERNIPFIGLRYGFLDEKVNNYKPEIAQVQLEHFGKLLSDEEALNIIQSK